MEKAGLKSEFIQGQRVTDEATVKIVDEVLSREINPEIVKAINSLGGAAVGFSGADIFKCKKMLLDDKENPGQKIDIGYVGEVIEVNVAPLKESIWCGHTPVISPTARGEDGKDLQLQRRHRRRDDRDCAECETARFHERRSRPDARPEGCFHIIAHLQTGEVPALKAAGIVDKGMIPKVDSAVAAIKSGVEKVSFVDGRVPHSVLLEIFTDKGNGTEIVL